MSKFKINYKEPETLEYKTVLREFHDTEYRGDVITAEEWAEDYAYSIADKGEYSIKRILKNRQE